MAVVIAIDAGTTGVRAFAVDEEGRPAGWSHREFPQYFPTPGWVEHDPGEIWDATRTVLAELVGTLTQPVAAVGITNQRETVVAWSRRTGEPLARAIVWQDRRTAARCEALAAAGHLDLVRQRTGLVLDPYFSGTKMAWLLDEGGVRADADLALGTVDSWILWNLTGGTASAGAVFATEASNASRTMLYDLGARRWSDELAELVGVPLTALAELRPSSGEFGRCAPGASALAAGTPVAGIAGDQQAALFGQACFEPGMTKNTYGTGSFVLMNVGATCPPPAPGLLSTVGWELADGSVSYALEGSIFVTGAAIQWLRDGLAIIDEAADVGPLAASVPDTGDVYVVPAFTGLGSPHWDPYARGTIVGITRGTTGAHLARAVVESLAYQTRDVLDAMTAAAGSGLAELRVDGGASAMDLLLQIQADQLGVVVTRPTLTETTAAGAAYLAGLGAGVWADTAELAGRWRAERRFQPAPDRRSADARHRRWTAAVERSRGWAER